ncbi:twin-arginine translocation signal domain-containing protein [Haloarchaeobius sp. HRN-SO-5]|uniref:twin-arginine translocation signal domain-containing protein n=1 Tax=Haloarchaeobius sp. HRN-SO-5 TaxID=3446118 RepID=UPI003EC03971
MPHGRRAFLKKASAGIGAATVGLHTLADPAAAAGSPGDSWERYSESVYYNGGIDTNDLLYHHDFQVNFLDSYQNSPDYSHLIFELFGTGAERQRQDTGDHWVSYSMDIVEEIGFSVNSPNYGVTVFQDESQEEQMSASAIPKDEAYTTNELLADAALSLATGGVGSMVARKVAVQGVKKFATKKAIQEASKEIVNWLVDEYKQTTPKDDLEETWTNQDVFDMLTPRERHTQSYYTQFTVKVPASYDTIDLNLDSFAQFTTDLSGGYREDCSVSLQLNVPGSSNIL